MIQIFTTVVKVFLPLLVLVALTSFVQAQAPVITCPGTTVTYGDQSNNDAELWNAPTWWDPIVSSKDLAENAIPLSVTITDACTTGALKVKYTLYLDLDNNGSQETRVDSDTLPAANTIYFNNMGLAVTAGEQRQFDFRPVALANKYRFDLQVDAVSISEKKAQLIWRSSPTATTMAQLPYGTHKIKWVAGNGCGQQSTCEYTFTVRDEKPPIVACVNNLAVNLMNVNGGMLELWATDFLSFASDNTTPAGQITFGIRRNGMGTGFPLNADGTPQTSLQFLCWDLGTQLIELWAKDKAGNTSFCDALVIIQDNVSSCCFPTNIVSGSIVTEDLNGIEDVEVFAEDGQLIPSLPFYYGSIFTHTTGSYYMQIGQSTNSEIVRIRPILDLDPLNGVNTWDLILISKHILGLAPLSSPYKLIAADANRSGTVTTFDIVELRKLILGTYSKLPNNTSWRFVDKAQVFTNPENPFADSIRSTILLLVYEFPWNSNWNFIGAKVGDVDNTATPNGLTTPIEDRTEKTNFTLQDQNIQENEVVSLHFAAASNVAGYQMTLDLSQFELLEIIPQNDLTMDHFAIFDQAITMVAEQPNQGFDLRLRAKQAGQLSSMLAVNDKITRSVAFKANGASKGIELRFNPIQKEAIQLNQNVPNPWQTTTNIGFYLPEANAAVTFTVVDEIGRVIYTSTNGYPAGYNSIVLDESVVAHAGLYWYSLTTTQGQLVQKMIKI
jgi:hypothetical protein